MNIFHLDFVLRLKILSPNLPTENFVDLSDEFLERVYQNQIQNQTGQAEVLFRTVEERDEFFKRYALKFKNIAAAGGVVESESKILLIERLGVWDLPKGKIEKKEKTDEAAIREVEEETSVNNLKIVSELQPTYHIYPLKEGQLVLKTTYWFAMKTPKIQKTKPQAEEQITQAVWIDKNEINPNELKTYASIRQVLNDYFSITRQ